MADNTGKNFMKGFKAGLDDAKEEKEKKHEKSEEVEEKKD